MISRLRLLTVTELRLAVREPVSLALTAAFPLMLLVVLLGVFGNQPDAGFGGRGGTDYYVPAYAAATAAAMALVGLPVHAASYREQGILRRFAASGVSPAWVMAAQGASTVVLATAGAALMAGVGMVAYDAAPPADLLGVTAGFLAGAVAFSWMGLAIATLVGTARAGQAAGLILFFSMFFISGTGPPRSILPEWMQTLGNYLPMTAMVEAVQHPWWGVSGKTSTWLTLAAVTLISAGVVVARTGRER